MLLSFLYLAFRAVLRALVRSRRGLDLKDIELLVLRHELRCCAARSRDRSSALLIGRCSQRQPGTCRAHRAARDWSLHGRCCGGIGHLCGGGGANRLSGVVGRRCQMRCASWCCGSRRRIRAGAIGGFAAS